MSQMGYPIPAEGAVTRVFKNLRSRLGNDDDSESNASTFAVEMRDVANIIDWANDQSLVLIDELGRGTSIIEGLSITTAIFEKIKASGATIFFVTHFDRLISYAATFPENSVLRTEANNGFYKIETKVELASGYGISLARECGLPERLLLFALENINKVCCRIDQELYLINSLTVRTKGRYQNGSRRKPSGEDKLLRFAFFLL